MQWSRTDPLEAIIGKLEEITGYQPTSVLVGDSEGEAEKWGFLPFPQPSMTLMDCFMWVTSQLALLSDEEIVTLAVSSKMTISNSPLAIAVERVCQLRGLVDGSDR